MTALIKTKQTRIKCQIGQIPTEHKTQTSQENDKDNNSKPFISSHFTTLFLCAWIQGWTYNCPRKRFPKTFLDILQKYNVRSKIFTATTSDGNKIRHDGIRSKKQCQSKNRQLQKQLAKQDIFWCKVFRYRRSKDGHKAKASYYSDERPSHETSRLNHSLLTSKNSNVSINEEGS